MKNFKSFICFLTTLLFISCTSPDLTGDDALCAFRISGRDVTELSVDEDASEVTLSVFSDSPWTIENDSEWLDLSSESGKMTLLGTFVKISVESNPAEESRQAVLVLRSGKVSRQLTVIQKGRIVTQDGWEDAFTAVRNMGVGWNLGNTLDTWLKNGPDGSDWRSWETGWGQSVTKPELMTMMKAAGFDAIRVPVTWGPHMDASGKVNALWMDRVHEIVDYVLDAGMYCIINLHHDTGADKEAWVVADKEVYDRNKERYQNLWKQVAEEFNDYDHRLLFESYNEILDSRCSWCYPTNGYNYDESYAARAYDAVNGFAQTFVDAVRSTGGNNLYRNLVINTYAAANGSGSWSPYLKGPLERLELPEDVSDHHLIFQVHTYPDISDMNAVKAEVDEMYAVLAEHLVSKGAPVIIGEWGTSNVDTAPDYIHRREAMLEFADYFVRKAKQHEMATFYWMGLSNAAYRTVPVFNEPDLAETIVKAYHGQGHQGVYPVLDDFDVWYKVTYNEQWAELAIVNFPVSFDRYKGVKLVLASDPGDNLSVKMYGDGGKEQYTDVLSSESVFYFDPTILGAQCGRVTLQFSNKGRYTATVRYVSLIRNDGTEEIMTAEPFWGCSVELVAVPL